MHVPFAVLIKQDRSVAAGSEGLEDTWIVPAPNDLYTHTANCQEGWVANLPLQAAHEQKDERKSEKRHPEKRRAPDIGGLAVVLVLEQDLRSHVLGRACAAVHCQDSYS